MLPDRIPEDDLVVLEELLSKKNWRVLVKYIELLHYSNERDFLDNRNLDVVLYERGVVDGSKKLLKKIKDFKDFARDKYIPKG